MRTGRSKSDRGSGPRSSPLPRLADGALLALERPGVAWAAAFVALALLLLAAQRVSVGLQPTHLGVSYALLSLDPLAPAPSNPVGHRVLTPLVSYLVGLRGNAILVTNAIVAGLLLAVAYAWLRREGHAPRWAVLGASTLALSMVVLTTLRYGGYCDALTYLLVLLVWIARRRFVLAAALYFMALLNHESAAFMAPWVALALASVAPRRTGRACAAVGAALVAFGIARWIGGLLSPATEYTASFYLGPMLEDPLRWYRESAPHRLRGALAAFNLYWLLPLIAAFHAWRRGDRTAVALLLLPIPLAWAQLLLAYDVSRLMTLAFMAVLLSAEYLVRTGAYRARGWLLWLGVANWAIPQVNVAMGTVAAMGR